MLRRKQEVPGGIGKWYGIPYLRDKTRQGKAGGLDKLFMKGCFKW